MIIWINGAFGSGKTTLAEWLHGAIKPSHLYDPEEVGAFLWDNFPESLKRKGDFQDIELWRTFNYQMLRYMHEHYKGVLIVPMTLVKMQYYEEIMGQLIKDGIELKHFILMAGRETIKQRLRNRGEGENSWAEQQMDRCFEAFQTMNGIKIQTDAASVSEIGNWILKETQLKKASMDDENAMG